MTTKEHYLKLAREVVSGEQYSDKTMYGFYEDELITLCTRVAQEAREAALDEVIGRVRMRMGMYKSNNPRTDTMVAHKCGMMKAFDVVEKAIRELK